MLLHVAHKHCNIGVPLAFHTDRNLFDLRKLQSEFKTTSALVRELLFADDCALAVHTLHKAQTLLDQFVMASRRFGLSVCLKKTEVLFQPSPDNIYTTPVVTIDNTAFPVAETFCYLGSRIHRTGSLDDEITARLAEATAAFGCLRKLFWDDHGIRVDTKVPVYRAVVLTTLLYGSEFKQQRIDTAKTRRATRKAHTFTISSTSTSYILCDTRDSVANMELSSRSGSQD